MRRKIIFGLCLAVALGLSATGFLLNQRLVAQGTPQKAEPEPKKDDLFEILKGALDKKDVPQPLPAAPTLPALPASQGNVKEPSLPTPPPPTPVIPPPSLPQVKDDKPAAPPPT